MRKSSRESEKCVTKAAFNRVESLVRRKLCGNAISMFARLLHDDGSHAR